MQSRKSSSSVLPARTRAIIEAAFDRAASSLGAGELASLYGIARASARHQRFSPRNRLLLWGQAPHSRMVKGKQGWEALRRKVLPGAPAYYVIRPVSGGYGLMSVYDIDFTRGRAVRLPPPDVRLLRRLPSNKWEAAQQVAALIRGDGLESEIARLALLYNLGLFPWYKAAPQKVNLTGRELFSSAEKALKRADSAVKVLARSAPEAKAA